MDCKVYPLGNLKQYKYVVVLSEYQGQILLSRHKQRSTWETQGGHIEPGETPMEAAKRELYEESGAVAYDITPLCDYWAGVEGTDDWANGVVFRAVIHQLGTIPESEMAETQSFQTLPHNLTYPDITPVLFGHLQKKDVTIRAVTLEDSKNLAYIQTTSWKNAFAGILAPDVLAQHTDIASAEQMYQRVLRSGYGNGYILEIAGNPHCIAHWADLRNGDSPDCAELICIHSLPEHWRCGYGSMMMTRILRDITNAGYHKVVLWVFRDNQRAISFYQKHGFHPTDHTKNTFGAVEIMMEREL